MDYLWDTLAASKRLRSSGMPEKQSQATVEVVAKAVSGLVTREYLDERLESLESKLDARFESIDARFESIDARFEKTDARIEKLEATMEKKFAGQTMQILLIQIGLFGLLLTALAYFTQPLRAEPAGPENSEITANAAPIQSAQGTTLPQATISISPQPSRIWLFCGQIAV